MGPTDRKAREQAARREAILEGARDVFAEKGLRASTIDDIAQRAELGKGTIYLYFKSKEEMLAVLKREGLARLAARFRSAIDPAHPADENLRAICKAYVRFYREEPDFYWVLHFDTRSMDSTQAEAVFERLAPHGIECIGLVARVIQQGIDDGIFSRQVNPFEAAVIARASSSGVIFVFSQQVGPGRMMPLSVERVIETQAEVMIRGLKGMP